MEFINLVFLGILIVISPGSDFVLVLKNSINRGRKAGIFTAIGISLAISVHISYSMLGISYLISQSEALFTLVRYAGSAYLIYLGIKGIFARATSEKVIKVDNVEISAARYLAQGFLCNVLNPKTMLFFLSIFSQIIALDSSSDLTALLYGLYMMVLHGLWFCIVAIVFTSHAVQTRFQRMKRVINQACGVALVTFGSLLAFESL